MNLRPFFDQYEVLNAQQHFDTNYAGRKSRYGEVLYDMDILCSPGLWKRITKKQKPYKFSVSGERDWWHYSESKDGKLYRMTIDGQPKMENHDFFSKLMRNEENIKMRF